MPPLLRLPSGLSATRLLSLLLLLTLALVGLLAWQAMRVESAHRALARRVLLDYTDLAATEVSRRATNVIGTYGFGVAVRGVSRAWSVSMGHMPSRTDLERQLSGQALRAAALASTVFQVDPRCNAFQADDARVAVEVQRAIIAKLLEPPERPAAEYRVIAIPSAARTAGDGRSPPVRLFVVSNIIVIGGSAHWYAGFEVDRRELGAWFDEFILRDPLLPSSLASSDVARAAVHVRVRAPDQAEMARTPKTSWPGAGMTRVRRLEDQAENALGGFVAEVAIDPSAADRLVIGGLPSSQIEWLALLLVLAFGLTASALAQVVREQALTRERQDFVTRTSHELRTPVAQIRMFADTLLLDRVRTEEERRQSLEAIGRGARRLAHLVDNVMQFARRESQSDGLAREPRDLAALARQAIDEFVAMASPPPVIVLEAPAPVFAPVEAEAFRQILVNLLDNAVKYGRARAGDVRPVRVWVVADARAGTVELSVQDPGPGIPPAARAEVWEPYFRLDRDRRSSVAGAGIGLSVVRDLVSHHGGRTRIEDAPLGGARIVITFPGSPAAPPHAAAEMERA